MYKQNTTRVDFAAIAIATIEEATGKTIDEILKEKTGKDIYQLIEEKKFADTKDKNVVATKILGIVGGVGNNKYAPNDSIKRQDAAILLMKTAEYLGKKAEDGGLEFKDDAEISDYAKEAVKFVSGLKVMSGNADKTFTPKAKYTREQAYVTVYRLFESLAK